MIQLPRDGRSTVGAVCDRFIWNYRRKQCSGFDQSRLQPLRILRPTAVEKNFDGAEYLFRRLDPWEVCSTFDRNEARIRQE